MADSYGIFAPIRVRLYFNSYGTKYNTNNIGNKGADAIKIKKAIFVSIIVAALCIVLIWNIGIYFEWELIDRLTSILSLIETLIL